MGLNIKRLKNLIIRNFAVNAASFIKIVLSICLILFVISCLAHIGAKSMNFTALVVLSYIAWFIGGFWFSSHVFHEMHNPGTGYRFLTLPATNLEKLIYAWLISSPLVLLMVILVIHITALLTMIFCAIVFNLNYTGLHLFDYGFGRMTLLYMVIQPVFLLGALLFRKLNFFNTILWIGIVAFGFQIAAIIFTLIIFYPVSHYSFDESFFNHIWNSGFFTNILIPGIKSLFWYVLGPFFLLVSYFKLKEAELK